MIISKCCKKPVHIHYANEYGEYYRCDCCLHECATMFIKVHHKEMEDAEVQSGIVL